MTLRVVHCGTGNMGMEALRGIIHHPDLELVGQYVSSADKKGIDSGVIAGQDPVGVCATNNWNELLALKPDCLSYFGNAFGREKAAQEDICRFLEAGINAVTIVMFPWAHPATCPPDYLEPVETACKKGRSTAFFTGIDPGWATTDLAIASLACADKIQTVRVLELGWWGDYSAEYACREVFGFGQPPGYQPLLVTGNLIRDMWSPTIHELADALGVAIDELRVVYETDCTSVDIECGFGTVKAGTAAAVHFELQGMVKGKPVVIVEHNDLVGRGVGKKWRLPFGPKELAYRVEVEGDPGYTVELNFDYAPGAKITAMPAINAIPTICAASSGLKGPLDIPRYWGKNVQP
jgi:hypothetical protein